ncbi:hypothetical protein DMA11_16505 [Marinilabiliaceae bacterium JC017]|nr:hypothetical protein DMA11_16505 [Marinilabiliaceae bacterium JC017]
MEREQCAKLQQAFCWNGNGAQNCNRLSVGTGTVRRIATAFPMEREQCAELQQAFRWNGNGAQNCNRLSVGTGITNEPDTNRSNIYYLKTNLDKPEK